MYSSSSGGLRGGCSSSSSSSSFPRGGGGQQTRCAVRVRTRGALSVARAAIGTIGGRRSGARHGDERREEEAGNAFGAWGEGEEVFDEKNEVRLVRNGTEDWGAMRYACTLADDGSGAHVEMRVVQKGTRDATTAAAAAGSSEYSPLIVRWAVARREGGSWRACPYGWRTDPPKSWDSGDGKSWETEMQVEEPGRYSASVFVPFGTTKDDNGNTSHHHHDTLQYVVLVLRTIHYEWLKSKDNGDVYIHLPALPQSRANSAGGGDAPEDGSASSAPTEAAAVDAAAANDAERNMTRPETPPDMDYGWMGFVRRAGQLSCDGNGESPGTVAEIAASEPDSERSLMHRYANAAHLVQSNAGSRNALLSVLVWLRLTAARELTWNKNYNVKPREIAVKQELCGRAIASLFDAEDADFELLRLLVAAVGRGGSSEAGQRIRDEILHIQRNSDCKGGMMEEWHQKLHNNTSPDDVVICEALLAYIHSGRSLDAYWGHLNANGVTAERMKSYDRPICSEPCFNDHQAGSLAHDLGEYLFTLRAVHDGNDLNAAADSVLGYGRSSDRGAAVAINTVHGVVTDYLRDVLAHIKWCSGVGPPRDGGDEVGWLIGFLTAVTDCRAHLFPSLQSSHALGDRALDVIVLDIALDSTARRQCEQMLGSIRGADVRRQLQVLQFLLRSVILSSGSNALFVECLGELDSILSQAGGDEHGFTDALKDAAAKTVMKAMEEVGSRSEATMRALDAASRSVTSALNVRLEAAEEVKESITRGGTAAVMAQVMGSILPKLRTSSSGTWSIVSRGPEDDTHPATGRVTVVDSISEVATTEFEEPTVLVVKGQVSGDEDVPAGVVAVFTKSTIDVLCHLAVRARTERVLVGLVANPETAAPLHELEDSAGEFVRIAVATRGATHDAVIERASKAEIREACARARDKASFVPSLHLDAKKWCGKFILFHERGWNGKRVGAKALNLKQLRKALPSDIRIPRGVTIPYGSCEAVIADAANKSERSVLDALEKSEKGILDTASEAVDTVSRLHAPRALGKNIRALVGGESPLPSVAGGGTSTNAAEVEGADDICADLWNSVKRVWTSKWNQRAILACRKAGLDHSQISMSVLIQEAIDAEYAFVVHTRHPVTNSEEDLYCELVAGLGETLVGNYPGNALAFTVHKPTMKTSVDKFPTKSLALKLDRPTLICRSDSNCEDLPGFAGAGLFDSVFVSEPVEVAHDYSSDPIVSDPVFRDKYARAIAETSLKIASAFGGAAQDIEGVIDADGKIHIVQARPQM